MPPHLIAEVDPCAAATETSRSDAIRRLVELGLKAKPKGCFT
jgi:metal-responsive CopG/Arc/MetJ family transcriptional regulator